MPERVAFKSQRLLRLGFPRKENRRCSHFARLLSALLLLAVLGAISRAAPAAGEPASPSKSARLVTHAQQFRSLSGADYLAGCNFQLEGVITFVDTNRDLIVLQDGTGAVGLHVKWKNLVLRPGDRALLDGTGCAPYYAPFPDFPHRPAETYVWDDFEVPIDWETYYLCRMRGCVRPAVTGEYQFWIASDNSSELWLSSEADPSKAKKIASIGRFEWVDPRQWSRYPSQRSEPVHLTAGNLYYIEALHEQTTGGGHLSVAWSGPALEQTVIAAEFLTSWSDRTNVAAPSASGLVCEYWTNYAVGSVSGLGGPREFESIITVKEASARLLGTAAMPQPRRIELNQSLAASENFLWVQAEGVVKFAAEHDGLGILELSEGKAALQVRVRDCDAEFVRRLADATVRVEGVCEAVPKPGQMFVPAVIWTSAKHCTELVNERLPNRQMSANIPGMSVVSTNPAMQGFYGTRGVVTFKGRVFGRDYIFVQEDSAVMLVTLDNPSFEHHLRTGELVEIGGALDPRESISSITPLVVSSLGIGPMPAPVMRPLRPGSSSPNGRWSEIEGVVRRVNSNGTVTLVNRDGEAQLWLGGVDTGSLARYIDAEVRARGVLLVDLAEVPIVLVPWLRFLSVAEPPPANPFALPPTRIGGLCAAAAEAVPEHRARVIGQVTHTGDGWFFLQDESGGIRVRPIDLFRAKTGETVEVVGFPASPSHCALVEALVRPANIAKDIRPVQLTPAGALSGGQKRTLVQTKADYLGSKTNGSSVVFEFQERQRMFTATLTGRSPTILPGSRVRVTGVLDDEAGAFPYSIAASPTETVSAVNILLRSPRDLMILSGPPWWTLKRTLFLAGALLTILVVTLFWVQLLRRRLERQQAAQLVFSKRVLQRVEDERRRIAANLHDGLGQTLLVIKNQAIMASHSPPESELHHRLEQISGATSSALEEIRQITHGLRPYQIDRLGLTRTIRALVTRASETGSIVFASSVAEIDGLFDKEGEINVYRIVQEAVTNVVKHSHATEAAVVIKKRAAQVAISIRDNGRGFDPAETSVRAHDLGYGLSGIRERVRILRGTLAIDSRPGTGTILTVEVPLVFNRADSAV